MATITICPAITQIVSSMHKTTNLTIQRSRSGWHLTAFSFHADTNRIYQHPATGPVQYCMPKNERPNKHLIHCSSTPIKCQLDTLHHWLKISLHAKPTIAFWLPRVHLNSCLNSYFCNTNWKRVLPLSNSSQLYVPKKVRMVSRLVAAREHNVAVLLTSYRTTNWRT